MNICTICYPTAGGSGVIATELARGLVERGHEVHLVASEKPLRLGEGEDEPTFHEIRIPSYDLFPDPSYGMAAACRIGDVLEQYDIDLVHAHYAFPHALSSYLAADVVDRENLPIVTTLHGTDVYLAEDHPCHHDIAKASLHRSTSITAVSQFLADETARIFGNDFNIRVLPNFVDTDTFSPRENTEQREEICPEETCLLVHVSNYRPIKRSEDMIRLLRYVREQGQDAHLLMIGDGPERERVKGLLGEFHMREHATWVDPVENIEEHVSLGDFLVVTSERESFSMSALEGMACGLPVLNAAEGGIRELVRDGEDGFHTEDLFELAGKATELFNDKEAYGRMRKRVRKRAREKYDRSVIVQQYEQLYEDTVSEGKATG